MANKLTTVSYFLKRLRDSGYVADNVFDRFSTLDSRIWMVVIDPGCACVFVTCYVNDPALGDSYFEMYDGGRYIPGRLKLDTTSIETFIGYLVQFGINNKSRNYPKS